ncbi:Uncharacterized protein APZ42_002339 [Daphnia magna]|uniref:Uncharacterized protein n=1 Tax=Daphnia magna TaxID=35525 RepID=A0A164IBQ5_9CRUS|nr:Uncharacterized protein APZ42_002339 [Daphnia magna]
MMTLVVVVQDKMEHGLERHHSENGSVQGCPYYHHKKIRSVLAFPTCFHTGTPAGTYSLKVVVYAMLTSYLQFEIHQALPTVLIQHIQLKIPYIYLFGCWGKV